MFNFPITEPRASLLGLQTLYNGCPNLTDISLTVTSRFPSLTAIHPVQSRAAVVDSLLLGSLMHDDDIITRQNTEMMSMFVRVLFPQTKDVTFYAFNGEEEENPGEYADQALDWWYAYRDIDPAQIRRLLETKIKILSRR